MDFRCIRVLLILFAAFVLPTSATAADKGYLQVNVSVEAEVFVDGRFMGESSPASVLNIMEGFPVGSVEVRVEAQGYKTASRRYSINANQWTQAVFYLEKDKPAAPPTPPPGITIGSPAPPARPAPPRADPITTLLHTCRGHLTANRLTTPAGRNAADCYNTVLDRDPGNAQALSGLRSIESKYEGWTRAALRKGQIGKARSYLSRLESLNTANPAIIELSSAIDDAASRAQTAAKPAPEPAPRDEAQPPTLGISGPAMILIDGDCFNMGSPNDEPERDSDERLHKVCINDFEIATNEVSVGDFRRFTEATGYRTEAEKNLDPGNGCFSEDSDGAWRYVLGRSWRNPGFTQTDEHPVVCVSWRDALAYIDWLSDTTGRKFRLPTEAEWEYATRAGDTGAQPWAGTPEQACKHGSVADETASEQYNSLMTHPCNDSFAQTSPVGKFRPNAFGLRDTMANVSEWTCSYYGADFKGSEKKCARSSKGGLRVNRGAAWNTAPAWARYATRMRLRPGGRADSLGFRLASDIKNTR